MDVKKARRQIIRNSPHLVTLSDSDILNFNTDMKSRVKECKIHFSPVQASGTPAPDNVLPISGWSEVTVNRTGANLWDEEWEVGLISAETGNNVANDSYSRTKNYISVKPGKAYNFLPASKRLYLRLYGQNKAFITYVQLNAVSSDTRNYTIPSGVYYLRFVWDGNTYGNDISINYSATDTAYHPYTGATYPVTFPTVGKNLTKLEQGSLSLANGSEITSTTRVRTNFIPVEQATQYIASSQNNGWSIRNGIGYNSEKQFVNYDIYPDISTGIFVTNNSSIKYVRFVYSHTNGNETCTPEDYWYQFEKGSSATAYEPYTTTVYGGYIDLVKGELVAEWGIYHLANSTFIKNTGGGDTIFYSTAGPIENMKTWSSYFHKLNWYCDRFKVGTTNSQPQANYEITATINSATLRIRDDAYSDAESFKASLGNSYLVYELATPITYQLTPQQLSVFKGTNNIWSNANGNIDLSFWTHGGEVKGLPAEYQRVEYLESTGTQYILTDYIPNANTTTKAVASFPSADIACYSGCLSGIGEGGNTSVYIAGVSKNTGKWLIRIFTLGNIENQSISDAWNYSSGFHTFETDARTGYMAVDGIGETRTIQGRTNFSAKLALFCSTNTVLNSLDGLGNGCKIKYVVISELGIKKMECIPCVRKSDNKPGMYDMVSQTFYTNAGTGEFLVPTT